MRIMIRNGDNFTIAGTIRIVKGKLEFDIPDEGFKREIMSAPKEVMTDPEKYLNFIIGRFTFSTMVLLVKETDDAKGLQRFFKGGSGSGNHGHAGRPGRLGGSAPGHGGGGSGAASQDNKPKPTKPKPETSSDKIRGHRTEHPKNIADATKLIMEDTGSSEKEAFKMYVAMNGWCSISYMSMRKEGDKNENTRYLKKYIEKSPKWNGNGPVYRGMGMDAKKVKDLKPGKTLDMKGASSWTSSEGVAHKFADGHANDPSSQAQIIFKLDKANHGTSIRHLSSMPAENEVVLSDKVSFKITKVEEDKSWEQPNRAKVYNVYVQEAKLTRKKEPIAVISEEKKNKKITIYDKWDIDSEIGINIHDDGKKLGLQIFFKGGPDSGNHGHVGRPGRVGGSAPSGGGNRIGSKQKATAFVADVLNLTDVTFTKVKEGKKNYDIKGYTGHPYQDMEYGLMASGFKNKNSEGSVVLHNRQDTWQDHNSHTITTKERAGKGDYKGMHEIDANIIRTRQKIAEADPQKFINQRNKLDVSKKTYLTDYTAKEIKDHGMKPFLSEDKQSGCIIAPDGDLGNVFSLNHHGRDVVEFAIVNGAKKLDCFDDGKLPKFYSEFGFKEYKREKNWTPGEPDVVYMHREEGKMFKSLEELRDKKRREMVERMKENGITYEQAADAFMDMMGDEEE